MQSLGFYKRKRISVVPHSVQKYISFSLGSLRFLDSFQFLPNSLAGLVDDLVKEDSKHFKTLRKQFSNEERFNLLLRKGVYPYSWVDCESKFESEDLPPRQAFRNDLTKSSISDEDYDHAKAVWNTFQLRNFGSYHDLYLTSDVCQLSDVFEQFRDEGLSTYGLDPLHFYTSPGLAWASALKLSKCKLELITRDNADAYLFIEAGIRGGISHVSNRFATANNQYIPETYDHSKPSSYTMYVDCNNLYGVAMSKSLPVSGFRYLNKQERSDFDVMNADVDGEKGQILDVDLEYPEHLHDLHSDYSLAPETKPVTDEMLSPYSKKLWEKLHPKKNSQAQKRRPKTSKLLCTLEPKRNYICHIKNLQLYLKSGMKLKRVHRILEFTQSPFLKDYIDMNTKRRREAKGEFQKNFFKVMNNAVFGKTIENMRARVDVQLFHTKRKILRQIARPSFERCEIFTKDLVAVQNKKTLLKLNKPIAIGMCISELSKVVMYEYHFNYVIPKYQDRVKILLSDTDSFLMYVYTDDIYADMKEDKHF